ncbi:hypothetical protein H5P28_12780 [Ruficoccus amylovorans]|uniref:Permuted papain-like amidase enzyme, YaeF/YiiX, C92 family n=1 Tax=Ruficoccus amylovorans TaxID=1804625 RepID=A0A842HEV5_9BACT|nr:YiiX/YebB-like N1pC/P60 family cysteine hydrolase [Ruficoccus amylovorans]MBC2595135.1 hypothetical protein [Ruficoccus amylovorans]
MKSFFNKTHFYNTDTVYPSRGGLEELLDLRTGDVIFTRIGGFLFGRVAEATGSWTSHVGVLHHCEDGRWWVAESAVPRVRLTPLEKFVDRSERGRFEIRRLREGLSPEQERRMVKAAYRHLGVWYDFGFNFDSRRQFCSKFVDAVYREAVGFGVGRVERFSALLARQPKAALGFWRWWFAGWIPLRRRTVSPASQAGDPRFVTVAEGIKDPSPAGRSEPCWRIRQGGEWAAEALAPAAGLVGVARSGEPAGFGPGETTAPARHMLGTPRESGGSDTSGKPLPGGVLSLAGADGKRLALERISI